MIRDRSSPSPNPRSPGRANARMEHLRSRSGAGRAPKERGWATPGVSLFHLRRDPHPWRPQASRQPQEEAGRNPGVARVLKPCAPVAPAWKPTADGDPRGARACRRLPYPPTHPPTQPSRCPEPAKQPRHVSRTPLPFPRVGFAAQARPGLALSPPLLCRGSSPWAAAAPSERLDLSSPSSAPWEQASWGARIGWRRASLDTPPAAPGRSGARTTRCRRLVFGSGSSEAGGSRTPRLTGESHGSCSPSRGGGGGSLRSSLRTGPLLGSRTAGRRKVREG